MPTQDPSPLGHLICQSQPLYWGSPDKIGSLGNLYNDEQMRRYFVQQQPQWPSPFDWGPLLGQRITQPPAPVAPPAVAAPPTCECGATIRKRAIYCYACGEKLKEEMSDFLAGMILCGSVVIGSILLTLAMRWFW